MVAKLQVRSEPFSMHYSGDSIGDTEFVESKRYAELLVEEIPQNRRSDALVALFEVRTTVDARKLRFLISTLLSALDEPQLAQYLAIVSDEMRTATEFAAIRSLLQMLTPELWPKTSEASRLRIENKLIREIKEGEILVRGKTTGALCTWAGSFMKAFTLRKEGANILISKLEDNDADDRHYVAKHFLHHLPEILIEEGETKRAVRAISTAIRNEDPNLREAVINRIRTFPTSWQSKLSAELQDITDPKNPAVVLDDGAPFLAAPTAAEITDDDIPF
jgi:hypothetical protein